MTIDSIKIRIKNVLNTIWRLCTTQSKERLPLSGALAVYVAFCPLVGLHTVLVFLFAWLFSLNVPLLLIISCAINNPWTMIPIYALGHFIGTVILNWLHIDAFAYNPQILDCVNQWLRSFLGIEGVSLLAFMVGGNILAILLGLVVYVVGWGILYSRFKTHPFQKN